MSEIAVLKIREPYLVFLGDEDRFKHVKTGAGLAHWKREACVGQLRLTSETCSVGLPDVTIDEAIEAGAKSLVIGVSPAGGALRESWMPSLCAAAENGLDIVAGLHNKLADEPELMCAAEMGGSRLVDVRVPPRDLPVGTGRKRSGRRLLTVGTDCALGKKYTALTITRDMHRRTWKADFRASGQTGIMIAGKGIPIDAVVSDFVSGAAELLSPDNESDHWDVIEGQGSLFHPGFAGVSLGLLHGSQADAIVVCHDPTRETIAGYPDYPIPDISDCIETHLHLARRTNPNALCVGISLNTSQMSEEARAVCKAQLSEQTGLPCIDPILDGTGEILDHLEQLGMGPEA